MYPHYIYWSSVLIVHLLLHLYICFIALVTSYIAGHMVYQKVKTDSHDQKKYFQILENVK